MSFLFGLVNLLVICVSSVLFYLVFESTQERGTRYFLLILNAGVIVVSTVLLLINWGIVIK